MLPHTGLSAALALRILDEAADGVLVTDQSLSDNPVIYANPAFASISGYEISEILGRNCRFLQGLDQDQPEIRLMRDAIASDQHLTVTLRNYRRDGAMFWNEVRLAPLCLTGCPGSRATHYVGFQRDVTARVVGEIERRSALREGEEANAARLRFLAAMGHEFRTPISIIMGFVELLIGAAEQSRSEPRQREYLTEIDLAARHLLQLAEDARQYVVVNATKELLLIPTPLTAVLQDATRRVGEMLKEADVSLELQDYPDAPVVAANAPLLCHAFTTLIGKLVRRASRGAQIDVRVHAEDGEAVVDLRCASLFLTMQVLDEIRRPFASGLEIHVRGLEGAGIAFAMAERIMVLHKGDAWIESTATDGTCFHVSLPLAPAAKPR